MRKLNYLIIVVLIGLFFVACKAKNIYIPIETVKTEYKNKYLRDSIYLLDSVMIQKKGDTIYQNRWRTHYRDRILHDTLIVRDTIRVPYPVIEYKEVNRLNAFQSFLVWCGVIALGYNLIVLIWRKWIKKK